MSLDPLAARNAAPAVRSPAVVDAAARQAQVQANDNGTNPNSGGDQELTFWDVLDIVNPLQHIPVVNSIYRAVTGDQIKPAMQIAGSALFGGVIGGAVALASAVVEEVSGDSVTGHIVSGLGFGDDKTAVAKAPAAARPEQSATAQASAAPPAPSQPAPPRPAPSQQQQMQAQQAAGQGAASAPAGALSGALAAAGGRGPAQGANPNDVMRSGHVPGKMPARDVMLTTNMPRDSRGANLDHAPAVDRTGLALPRARSAANAAPAAGQAAPNATAPNAPPNAPTAATPTAAPTLQAVPQAVPAQPPTPANPDAMADAMLRNLAKYQAGKRAPAPTMRTSG